MRTEADGTPAAPASTAVPEARVQLLLGRGWLERGRERPAALHLARALALAPHDAVVQRWMAYLRVFQGALAEADEHLQAAVRLAPADAALQREASALRQYRGLPPEPVDLADHPGGRLRFRVRWQRDIHRSGWRYATEALERLHHRDGVLFESFLEDPFAWQHRRGGIRTGPGVLDGLRHLDDEERSLTSEERGIVPFTEPWVGFLHNPPGMPAWFHGGSAPEAILGKRVWQDSLPHCIGLFALSEHHARWLRAATGKPVSAVLHPTEIPAVRFDMDRFLANPRKRVVQVGWWLRRQTAIERLPLPDGNPLGCTKLRLVPEFVEGERDGVALHLRELRAREEAHDGPVGTDDTGSVEDRAHVPDDEYDALLAENVCFVSLYASSANNTVVECLARATPLLVNPLPAVREYLGDDYPLYYEDLPEAAAKALDVGRLRAAHEHLLASPVRARLDGDSFRRSVEDSEVYALL